MVLVYGEPSVVLTLAREPAFTTEVNVPPSEVIMSRCSHIS